MNAEDIHAEIMTMDSMDQRAIVRALEHIANKLCDFENELIRLNQDKQNRPYDPRERC